MNDLKLLGKLKEAPLLRTSKNGTDYCKITLVINEKTGKDTYADVEYDSIFVFGKTAQHFAKYGRKGSDCFITGKVQKKQKSEDNKYPGYEIRVFLAKIFGIDMSKPNEAVNGVPNVDDEDESNLPF